MKEVEQPRCSEILPGRDAGTGVNASWEDELHIQRQEWGSERKPLGQGGKRPIFCA